MIFMEYFSSDWRPAQSIHVNLSLYSYVKESFLVGLAAFLNVLFIPLAVR